MKLAIAQTILIDRLEQIVLVFVLFDLILYVPVNKFSVMFGQVFQG